MAAYQALLESGGFHRRAGEAISPLACCTLCPRCCEADRLSGEKGKGLAVRRLLL